MSSAPNPTSSICLARIDSLQLIGTESNDDDGTEENSWFLTTDDIEPRLLLLLEEVKLSNFCEMPPRTLTINLCCVLLGNAYISSIG